jgi:NAD(P)-dependent dehydrogenase (short-subunit alcohol dehydrogenase family)
MSIPEMFDLGGKVAVVTGGARHLGYDMAEVLAEAGCELVITSRELAHAEVAAAKLRAKHGRDALALAVDVKDPGQAKFLAEKASQWKGHIDILVNNAGGGSGTGQNLFERSASDMADVLALNVLSTLYCCQEIGRFMAEQGRGKIINIGSIAGMVGRDRRMYERSGMKGQAADYAAAKAAVIGVTRDLAALLAPKGVCVNCISPGGFERGQMPRAFVQAYSDRTPLGRMGRDGIDLKGAALFLASPASDYITGQNLAVDG